jgi:hypothetical protein
MTTRNLHRVPAKSWNKWDATERRLFNAMWGQMKGAGLGALASEELWALPRRARFVLRYNASWLAAQSLRELRKDAR